MDRKPKKGMGLFAGVWIVVATFSSQAIAGAAALAEERSTLNSTQPQIATDPPWINVLILEADGIATRPLTVWNGTSVGTLDYSMTAAPNWLSVSPATGSSTGEATVHTVSVDPSGMDVGDYEGTITITAAGAANSPVVVPVRLTVLPPPAIGVVPSVLTLTLDVGQGPVQRMLAVKNTGAGTLNYQLAADPSLWVSLDRTSGSTRGAVHFHRMNLDTALLPPGHHRGTITITGNAPSTTIEISVTIREPDPAIGVVPSAIAISVNKGEGPVHRTIAVKNTGGHTLDYQLAADPPSWISLDRTTGACSSGVRLHRLTLDTAGLEAGLHSGTITVSGNAPSTAVAIAVTVHETAVDLPDLALSNVDIAPAAPTPIAPGEPLALGALLENRGSGAAGGFRVEVWGSRTGGLTLDELLVPSVFLSDGLDAGETFSWVTSSSLYSVPTGFYTVVYTVDRADEVEESDEGNNRLAVAGKRLLVMHTATNANIVVEDFGMAPNPAQSGQPVTFSGRVVNRGSDPTGPFWVEFWGSRVRPYPSLDFYLADSIPVPNLDPGEEVDLSGYARVLYNVPAGEFMVGCVADREDTVYESDETDNYQFVDGQVFENP